MSATATAELLDEIAEADARLDDLPAIEAVRWAVDRFGDGVVLASSFQDCVLIDLGLKVKQAIEVLFLDTRFHFDETLEFVDTCRKHFDPLNLTVLEPGPEAAPWPCGSERCCETRKVMPVQRHLVDRQAWITGLKRVDNDKRKDAPIVAFDPTMGVVKVNPMAAWTDDEVNAYLEENGLPVHPLIGQGYTSIGCAPMTRPVAEGDDPRSGRWVGSDKTECGLHL